MTAYNPDSTGDISFSFSESEKGELKAKTFKASLISESSMTLAAQMRVNSAVQSRDLVAATASRIAGRLRNVHVDGIPQKLTAERVAAMMDSEDTEMQGFVTKLIGEFSVAVGVASKEEVSDPN